MKRERIIATCAASAAVALAAFAVQAAGVSGTRLDEVTVTANRIGELAGTPDSASEGTVFAVQLENRPVLRTGELLEVVPGLVVTQHSGDGKANQYFLRGFNLDHGTDFAARVEGMPVNMPTHAHGQGYSDINFVIPELVDRIEYKKGTYYADEGNFSAAGSVDVSYQRALKDSLALLTLGEHSYARALIAVSAEFGGGDLLMGFDSTYTDGPWDLKEHFGKVNGVLKYSHGDIEQGFSVEAMGYGGEWRSTDQIPLRAVQSGQIDRFGNIDPTDGGSTHRYSLSGNYWSNLGPGRFTALLYDIGYKLDLFSNFTYFADDPVHGDQFEQFDKRTILGADLRYTQPVNLFGKDGELSSGIQVRYDDIAPVGLYRTENRQRLSTTRQDNVKQTSYSAFISERTNWTDWFRTELGVREDYFDFEVKSDLAANSGSTSDHIASPKVTMVFGPWSKTEIFVDWGRGFHSNDARGATIRIDPSDGVTPAEAFTPLVKATGEEIGVRTAIVPQVQLSASLWRLQLDSELLFAGDGGTTEPSRASERTGLELSVYFTPVAPLIIDADIAFARPRFTDKDPAGDRIPNAVERVYSVGATYRSATGWFGGARLRYLGPAALIEDDSVRSKPTTLVNLDAGYHFTERVSGTLTLLNAFDSRANDITYYYDSELRGEAAPVSDVHFHPVEPRELRATIAVKF